MVSRFHSVDPEELEREGCALGEAQESLEATKAAAKATREGLSD